MHRSVFFHKHSGSKTKVFWALRAEGKKEDEEERMSKKDDNDAQESVFKIVEVLILCYRFLIKLHNNA